MSAASASRARVFRSQREPIAVLDVDPDLGAGLAGPALADARAALVARELTPLAPVWTDHALDRLGDDAIGLLVTGGILARELALNDNVTTEILGPGDVIRSGAGDDPSRLLRSEVRWTTIEPARLAVLGPNFADALTHHPQVGAALMRRMVERSHRLLVSQAICQLVGVDQRILAMLWQHAERWGRITSEGVHVRLPLPHRLVAQLVGARRPTVSSALSALATRGQVTRIEDGTWMLHGEPVGLPSGDARRAIRTRRRRFVRDGDARVQRVTAASVPR